MTNWIDETAKYSQRWEDLLNNLPTQAPHPSQIPHGPLDQKPTPLQSLMHRASDFFEVGAWYRTRETTNAVSALWQNGSLSAVAPLVRLVFEIWAVAYSLRMALEDYQKSKDLEKLAKIVNKIFEGVKSEVLLPYGVPASETPIHILDAVRFLRSIYPNAVETYEYLCEAAHPNFPRYIEWWLVGKEGDNWSNKTVQKRGHELLDKTVSAMETSVLGVKEAVEQGLALSGIMYEEVA